MPWLVYNDTVVASLTIASTRADRRRGLLGHHSFDGALLIERARSVHTVGMRFPIDVAHLDQNGTVRVVRSMAPGRIGRWSWRTHSIVEAEAGAFRRWGIEPGVTLEVRQ